MEYYPISKKDLCIIFNKDIESDVDFPSPADACFISFLQSMSPEDRLTWLNNNLNET